MELAFLTLLLKDGANCVGRGVAINDEGVLEAGLAKDRGCTHGIDESLEGSFVFVFPIKFAALGTESYEGIKGSGEHAEVSNVHAVKIEEAKECA